MILSMCLVETSCQFVRNVLKEKKKKILGIMHPIVFGIEASLVSR